MMRMSLSLLLCVPMLALAAAPPPQRLPWYMQETAMSAGGRLTLLDKPWWPRALALAEGSSFTLDLNHDGRPDTLITRKDGNIVEAIDDSGMAPDIWNNVSTTYVVSLKGTGVVDRMVCYIDNDGDGKADEMDLRHYQDGYLRFAWFGENYDKDGAQIFELKNWSYAGNNGHNKFRGNLQIYLNKYDAKTGTWVPLSECPFAFWDPNHDGHGDTVLRVSAAPLATLTGPDADYANNYNYMWSAETTPLAAMGNLNVRFSMNLDPQPRREPPDQPHYTFGFTMVGAQPYRFPRMTYTNPRRRPPQTVTRINWNDGVNVAMSYPARETGFTWDESHSVWRWEGQFWIFERVYLSNTGGPTMRWNMRREYSPKPASSREIYYSEADRRFHLKGAVEGWLEAGYLAGRQQKDLEYRWADRDADGYLDECRVYLGDQQTPVRVSRFSPRAKDVPLTHDALLADYNERILPQAIAANTRLIASLKKAATSPAAEAWGAEAASAGYADRRRYCLDIARELYFLATRERLASRLAAQTPYPASTTPSRKRARSPEQSAPGEGYSLGDSLRFWKLARQVDAFDTAYGDGRLDDARTLLEGLLP
jgi:hypothetical protein